MLKHLGCEISGKHVRRDSCLTANHRLTVQLSRSVIPRPPRVWSSLPNDEAALCCQMRELSKGEGMLFNYAR